MSYKETVELVDVKKGDVLYESGLEMIALEDARIDSSSVRCNFKITKGGREFEAMHTINNSCYGPNLYRVVED